MAENVGGHPSGVSTTTRTTAREAGDYTGRGSLGLAGEQEDEENLEERRMHPAFIRRRECWLHAGQGHEGCLRYGSPGLGVGHQAGWKTRFDEGVVLWSSTTFGFGWPDLCSVGWTELPDTLCPTNVSRRASTFEKMGRRRVWHARAVVLWAEEGGRRWRVDVEAYHDLLGRKGSPTSTRRWIRRKSRGFPFGAAGGAALQARGGQFLEDFAVESIARSGRPEADRG